MTIQDRSWRLIQGIDLSTGATVTARFSGGTVTGSAGADRYRADYELRGSRLRIGPVETTGLTGDPVAERWEQDFLTLLGAVSGFHLDPSAQTLVLVDDADDEALTFTVVPDVTQNVVGRWIVRRLRRDGELVPPTSGAAHLAFDGTGQLSGTIGVSIVRGTARTDGERLYLAPRIATHMAGTPEELDEEAALMSALEDVHGYGTHDGELTLLDADGSALLVLDRA